MSNRLSNQSSKLSIRNARPGDVPQITGLSTRAYAGTGMPGYSEGAITGQINNFPDGQFASLTNRVLRGLSLPEKTCK